MTDRAAASLIGTVLVFITMWFIPYGMPHGARPVAYVAFAGLTFAALWSVQALRAAMQNTPPQP